MPKERIIIGLMSGTSVDGIDAAVVRVGGAAPRLTQEFIHLESCRWPGSMRRRLLAAMAPATISTEELCRLNAEVAWHFAQAALKAIAGAKIAPGKITAIASHGQTICHLPASDRRYHRRLYSKKVSDTVLLPSTLQLGDPSMIAALTGIVTIGNFRAADMALGGQGAPLVPWADAVIFQHRKKTRCIQNIGGIANVTYLPAFAGDPSNKGRGKKRFTAIPDSTLASAHPLEIPHPIRAFDTGPGNMLIDAVVSAATEGRQTFDRDGKIAARGRIDQQLFRALQAHPYFDRQPPKSTGREEFGSHLAGQIISQTARAPLPDVLATLTHLTAWSIADAYFNYLPGPPDEVILCGGGAKNRTLVGMLKEQLAAISPRHPIAVVPIDDFGIPNKAKEALSFALLGAATLDGVPANVPSVTGAARPTILGVVACPT